MKIIFFDTKSYDKESFTKELVNYPDIEVKFLKTELTPFTAELAHGYDAVCAFVSADISNDTIEVLNLCGVKLILLRCAGFNNVDLDTAKRFGIRVLRVPSYSPEAVAEHAMALALAVNRRLHKAYVRVRENDFSLNGLMGFNFYQKTAGIVGTGKIGAAMARICRGFGMKILAYDVFQNPDLKDFVTYVTLDELLAQSDLISLHCPLMDNTYHLINHDTIQKMKDGVLLVNTSRGALVKTDDLIEGIRARKFSGVGLDVYEEEGPNVYENRSDEILEHSVTARLLSFPNVMITSHQAFFTEEALAAIAKTTLGKREDLRARRRDSQRSEIKNTGDAAAICSIPVFLFHRDRFHFAEHAFGQVLYRHAASRRSGYKIFCIGFVERRKIFHICQEAGGLDHFVEAASGSFQDGSHIFTALFRLGRDPFRDISRRRIYRIWPDV